MAKEKREMAIRSAVEWAFGIEKAQLDLPDTRDIEDRGYGFGTEYVLMQRARLGGVKIDGGGRSYPHDDADMISAVVATIPRGLGGIPIAIRVAECGRNLTTPDWMPEAQTRILPVEWRARNQLGRWAKTEVIRRGINTIHTPHPKNPARTIKRRVPYTEEWCPITVEDHPQEIAAARREYSRWRAALAFVRDVLREGDLLGSIEITMTLPPDRPWQDRPAGVRSSATS